MATLLKVIGSSGSACGSCASSGCGTCKPAPPKLTRREPGKSVLAVSAGAILGGRAPFSVLLC